MISILMPIYNGIQFIEESVSSIKCQTYKDWELIIGINGHEKNSDVYNIAKKYDDRVNYRNVDPELRKLMMKNSYEPKGSQIFEKKSK